MLGCFICVVLRHWLQLSSFWMPRRRFGLEPEVIFRSFLLLPPSIGIAADVAPFRCCLLLCCCDVVLYGKYVGRRWSNDGFVQGLLPLDWGVLVDVVQTIHM